ncbi:hypothetical protein [Bradyrhizobium diazoefficiens]|uniref:hypothetical protein n=2 Tax=Bradyrhizobium TaxID=374 RepID=UPI003599FC61
MTAAPRLIHKGEDAMSNLARINLNYVSQSGDADRCCKRCFHFKSSTEGASGACDNSNGNCFGSVVSAEGVCQLFTYHNAGELDIGCFLNAIPY